MVFSELAEGRLIICQNYKAGAEIDKKYQSQVSVDIVRVVPTCCVLYLQDWIITYKESYALFLNLISSSLKLPKSRNFG